MSTNITGLAGEIIAFTYPSIIKIADNGNMPAVCGGNRNAAAVFQNSNRSGQPNALSVLSDGSGIVGSLAMGQQGSGAKVFGPLIVDGGTNSVVAKVVDIKNGGITVANQITVAGSGANNISGTTNLNVLNVATTSTLNGAVCVCSTLGVTGTATVNGCTTLNGGLNVTAGGLSVTGAINATNDITAFSTSDSRLKNNIIKINDSNKIINSLNGYKYEWNEKANQSGEGIGVIAQEVKELIPSAVRENDEGYLSVDYIKIIPYLIEEVKNLNNRIKILEEK